MSVNAQYSLARPESPASRIAGHQRRKMYRAFMAASGIGPDETILDVGATSDRDYSHSNYLVAWYPHKPRVTAIGIDDASHLEAEFPGVRVLRGDGRALPLADRSCDWAHSSAVIEHVGSEAEQTAFLRELWRIARKGIFVTTPNRWFPVEFHTVLPLLHWLPKPLHRRALVGLGREFFATEANLNLLSRADLLRMARNAGIGAAEIRTVGLLGWPTNLLLVAYRG